MVGWSLVWLNCISQTLCCSPRCQDLALCLSQGSLRRGFWLLGIRFGQRSHMRWTGLPSLAASPSCLRSKQYAYTKKHPPIARPSVSWSPNFRSWTLGKNNLNSYAYFGGARYWRCQRFAVWYLGVVHDLGPEKQEPDRDPNFDWMHLLTLHNECQPLYGFCNHSCEANTALKMVSGHAHSTKFLYAKRQIKRGEQICVSYSTAITAGLGIESKEERQEILGRQIGWDGCFCKICKREIWTDSGKKNGKCAQPSAAPKVRRVGLMMDSVWGWQSKWRNKTADFTMLYPNLYCCSIRYMVRMMPMFYWTHSNIN